MHADAQIGQTFFEKSSLIIKGQFEKISRRNATLFNQLSKVHLFPNLFSKVPLIQSIYCKGISRCEVVNLRDKKAMMFQTGFPTKTRTAFIGRKKIFLFGNKKGIQAVSLTEFYFSCCICQRLTP